VTSLIIFKSGFLKYNLLDFLLL